jgi:hypothetical protein
MSSLKPARAVSRAVSRIEEHGALLVFPIKNQPLPRSLWSEFFPKHEMVWEWDQDSDQRVADTWQLMKQLSSSGEVVYSKWYQGRATFFSLELFSALLSVTRTATLSRHTLSETARQLYEVLENNSPLSTKQLKACTDMQGRANEAAYSRGMKELFTSFLIVGFGEVEDGAFPSLAVGATELLFEDVWREAVAMDQVKAQTLLDRCMPQGTHFRRFLHKTV